MRLNSSSLLPTDVRKPVYTPAHHGVGIVHLGVGAFHKAHQAVYTDDALAASGGDWRIAGVSLRSSRIAQSLNPQQGLYSLFVRQGRESDCRIIGSLKSVSALRETEASTVSAVDYERLIALLTNPAIRIVTLTVTEKAYAIDRHSGKIDLDNPAIQIDLQHPESATGVVGLLSNALHRRLKTGHSPFTLVCCDNLPENGQLLKSGLIDFSRRINNKLATHIENSVACPSTMVDRITPATTPTLLQEAQTRLGVSDLASVETESFSQWVIEDNFPDGRPAWEAGGALFVADVAPYEMMKLRMLNGAHSLLAYAGYPAGFTYVRDTMTSTGICRWTNALMSAAAKTLDSNLDIDYAAYAASLMKRFQNPSIAHETYQIAMDGTEKLPQRIFAPLTHALENDLEIDPYAFAIAAWMYYCRGRTESGASYELRDPREEEIASLYRAYGHSTQQLVESLCHMQGFMPAAIANNSQVRSDIGGHLKTMLEKGMDAALR